MLYITSDQSPTTPPPIEKKTLGPSNYAPPLYVTMNYIPLPFPHKIHDEEKK